MRLSNLLRVEAEARRDRLVRRAGGRFIGLQENPAGRPYVALDDPVTRTTLMVPIEVFAGDDAAVVETIRERIAASRAKYGEQLTRGGNP